MTTPPLAAGVLQTADAKPASGGREPTGVEAAVFCAILLGICAAAATLRGYTASVAANGDNAAYAQVTSAILHWKPASAGSVKQFWGLPYFAALFSALFRTSELQSIAIVSVASTLASAALAAELWSGWVAAYFVAGNYTLIQMGAFGGAEPLFVLLILVSFRLSRQRRWIAATLAASFSTVVRPLGVFLLAGLWTRIRGNARLLALSVALACGIGLLYAAPLALYLGTPLAQWTSYRNQDWAGRAPVSFPLAALAANFRNRANVGNAGMVAVKLGYAALHVVAIVAIVLNRTRRKAFFGTEESVMVILYSAFLLVYNAPTWALSIYPRLLIPITPMLLHAYQDVLPKKRAVVAALGLISTCLAVGANIGFARIQTLFHL